MSHVRMFIRANYMSWGIYYSVSIRNKYAAYVSVAMVTDISTGLGPIECTKSPVVSSVLIHFQLVDRNQCPCVYSKLKN